MNKKQDLLQLIRQAEPTLISDILANRLELVPEEDLVIISYPTLQAGSFLWPNKLTTSCLVVCSVALKCFGNLEPGRGFEKLISKELGLGETDIRKAFDEVIELSKNK